MADPDRLFFGMAYKPDATEPINFVENAFMYLSPFSAHEIVVEGVVCKTVEHGYHALRLVPGKEREEVLKTGSPMEAWRVGQKYKNNPALQIEGYNKYALMEQLCRLKLQQHADIRTVLFESKNRELQKMFDTDYYWGTGADGTGENQLGKIWMKLRDELQ